MHESVRAWVQARVKQHSLAERKTLEVGSRDVNGSVRGLFRGEYVGVDMQEGNGVDLVARADKLPFPARSFEVVVSTEMLEHDPYPWKSLPEMARVLERGGYLLLTCRGPGFHDDPNPKDYWRFTCDAVEHLLKIARLLPLEVIPDTDSEHEGVFALARKRSDRKGA